MADETQVEVQAAAQAAAEAPAKVAKAVAETAEAVVNESAKVAKRTRTATRRQRRAAPIEQAPAKTVSGKRRAARAAAATPAAATSATNSATKAASRRIARKTRVTAAGTAAVKERTPTVTKNLYNGLEAVPAFAPFQNLFNEANERSQEFVKRGQKVAEELADLARANVEAVVEAGRVASEGARSIGQDVVAKQRDSFEQAADAIRSLAEAKSPTEYLQLQSDFARASFDRAVAESSKFTESLVKLAGEAFQPLSNRASANAERFNTLVA